MREARKKRKRKTAGRHSIRAMQQLEDVPRPEALLVPLRLPHKVLLGPGPSNAPPRVLHAAALPLLGHLHPETLHVMDEIKTGLQYAFQTRNTATLCVSATGHAGMEAALSNLLEPGDTAVIHEAGLWGERAADIATRHGARVVKLKSQLGEPVSLRIAEDAVMTHKPKLLFLVHGETSTGVLQPLEGFGEMCHKHGALLVVDAVATLGGVPLWTDRWQLDVVYSASQKVLGAPPGLAPISFSPRAVACVEARKKPCDVYYFDLKDLGDYWGCFGRRRKYHHTGPVSLYFALREALSILAEEGLSASWTRHQDAGQRMYDAVPRMGLPLLVRDPRYRLPTVIAIVTPAKLDREAVRQRAMDRHGVEIAGGLGPTAGRILRFGFMGVNACPARVDLAISVLEDALFNTKSCKL